MDSIFEGAPDVAQTQTSKRQQLVRQVLKLVFNADLGDGTGKLDEKDLRQALKDAHVIAQEIKKDGEKAAPTNDTGPVLGDINAKLRELKAERTGEFQQGLDDLYRKLQSAKPVEVERAVAELTAAVKSLKPADFSKLERTVQDMATAMRDRSQEDASKQRLDDIAKSGQAVIRTVSGDLQAHGDRILGAVQQTHEKTLASLADTNAKLFELNTAPDTVIPTFDVHVVSRDENGQIKRAKLVPV